MSERHMLSTLAELVTGNPWAETGEYKCVCEPDLTSFDMDGTDDMLRRRTCRNYHRTRQAAERHCAKLNRETR